MRDFKKVEIDGEIYLYPVPVIKNNKYLIYCGTENDSIQVMAAIARKAVTHPDENRNDFEIIRHHTDGVTPILAVYRK